MGETENPENSGVSDSTDGEQEEDTEGEETPVIDEENNSEEDQEQEEETSAEDLEAAVMGEEVTPMANENGTFTVHFPSDSATVTVAGDATTTAGQDYSFTVTPKEGYENPTAKAYTGTDNTGAEVTVGEPVEAEGVYTFTIASETLSAIDTEVTDITIEADAAAAIQKRLYPSIDNDQKDKWTLTPVEGLSAEGKTYITAKTFGGWDGFADAEGTDYSSNGIAANELEGKILAFGVDVKDGYQFASVNSDEQVKATLLGWNEEASDIQLSTVSASYVDGHYEIDLGEYFNASNFTGYNGLRLIVWADVEAERPLSQYSLYVTWDANVGKLEYSLTPEDEAAWIQMNDDKKPWQTYYQENFEENTAVYVRITPKTGYACSVLDNGGSPLTKVEGQDYYKVSMTGDLNLTVESTGAEGSHSLTVMRDTGIDSVRYTTGDPEQPLRDWTPINNKTTGIPRFNAGTVVYVRVSPTHGYTYGVEKKYADDPKATEATKEAGKEYYKFEMTSDLTLSITAAPEADTHRLIIKTNENEEFSPIEEISYTIKDTDVEDVYAEWGWEGENIVYDPVVVKDGESVTLKIVPCEDYIVEVTKNGRSLTGENNIYDLGVITEDVTVMVEATIGRFGVYQNIYGDPGYQNCQIVYQGDCVKGDDDNGYYIAKDTPLTFKVTAPADAKIRSVSYSSGYWDESEEDWHFVGNSDELTADKDGIYNIPADKIVGAVWINVWIHDSDNHPGNVFVCWNDVTGLKQVDATYIDTAGTERNATLTLSDIWDGTGVYAKEGTQLTFKLTPDTCYSIDKVTYDGKELSPDKDGTYKIEKIDGGYDDSYGMWRKIGVSAKVDSKKTFTFDYQLNGDDGSVEADVIVKEGTDERYEFVLNKSQKITTIAGDTLNVTVRPKEGYKITIFDGTEITGIQQTTAQTKTINYNAENKIGTLSVTTVPEASTGAKTVTFTVSGNAVHITNYEVTKGDGVTEYKEGDKVVKDKYAIADKAERLKFAITAKGDYKPVVTRMAADGETRTEVSPVGDPAVKNGDKVYSYTIPAGVLAAAGDIEINEERDQDAAKCAKVRVYEENDRQEVVPKGTSYGVETWKTYRIVGYNQWYGESDEDIWCDLSDAKVYLGNAKDPIKHDNESYPSYNESGLNCADYDGDLLLAIGQGAAGQTITVEIDAKTKITLQTTPAVTEVSLKDKKTEITQAPGTLQSYPLTITDAKSTDALRVEVKTVNVTKGTTTTPSSNRYFDAKIVGNSLDISTEPFKDGVTSVEATLTFINASKEDATGRTASVSKDQKEITLTIAPLKDKDGNDISLTPADKITLKKGTTTVYTGQEKIKVATVVFGKNTLNRGSDVEVYEIPEGFHIYVDGERKEPDPKSGCVQLDKSLDIEVGVDKGAVIGKQTIKVRTTYQMQKGENDEQPYDPVQAMASIPVTVVRGIESITASSAPQIYKKDAKTAGTAKIAVEYNANGEFEYADAKSAAPKAKKVTYDICNTDEDVDAGVLGYNSKGQPMVTVKNGTVTVDKEYTVKAEEGRNQFSVRVKAADYAGNDTETFVDFTVVGKPAELGKIVFVNGDNKQVWDGESGEPVKSFVINELDGVRAVVLKKTVESAADKQYAEDDSDFVDDTLYTMTPAKGNVYVDADGYIVVNKLAKNIVIKAATNDGGKQTAASGKFTVTANENVTVADAKVECVADWGDVEPKYLDSTHTSDTFTNTPSAAVIQLKVTDKDKKEISGTSIFDLKMAVSGAKVVKKSADTLALDIVMTKSPVKVTLSGLGGKKEYTLINPALDKNSEEFGALQKTPAVSLKKGLKLYAGVSGQKLSFTMKNAVKDARYVVVSAQDMEADTGTLMDYFGMYDYATLNPNVTEFSYTCGDKLPELKKGASIAFTFLDRDYNVLTQTTKAVKIKTTVLKKSYKLNAKYTLSEMDAASVPLTGKGSGVKRVNGVDCVKFTALYNANNKGTVNKFKDGFELDEEHGLLKLKTAKDESGKEYVVARKWLEDKNKNKNNWTGFVEYTVTYEDGTQATFVTKITTALSKSATTTAKKYAASAVNVLKSDNMEGVTYITIGKLPADVVAAYAQPKDTGAFEVVKVKDTTLDKINGNAVTLKITSDKATATYKGDLYVVPKDSLFADQTTWDFTKKEDKEKAVVVPVTVNVKALTSSGKIKVTTKSVSFLDIEPKKLALETKGNDGKPVVKFGNYYYAEIPYTANIQANIETITLKDTEKNPKLTIADAGVEIRKVNNKSALGLYIDAEAFQKQVDQNKAWSGAAFPKAVMEVAFGEGTKSESIKFSLTMPNPWGKVDPDDYTTEEKLLNKALQIIRDTIVKSDVNGIEEVEFKTATRTLVVTANSSSQEIANALPEATMNKIADELLKDVELKGYVDKLSELKVEVKGDTVDKGTIVTKEEGQNKQFVLDLVKHYTQRLVEMLQSEGKEPVFGSLADREITLNLEATSMNGTKSTQSCTVQFRLDGDLDAAIISAVNRLNSEKVIPGVKNIEYSGKMITITGDNKDQDIMESKNAGRDAVVQILLSEMGSYMDGVSEVTFIHGESGVRDYVTVTRDKHTGTEAYISDLVDKWTGKLVGVLQGRGEPTVYGSLDGKKLQVQVKDDSGKTSNYAIEFKVEK